MRMLTVPTVMALLALAACSTPSDIVKTGAETYRVRSDAGGGSPNDAEIKARGIKRANEFCEALGKRAVITVGQRSGWFVFGLQTAEVSFYCDERLAARPASTSSKP